MHVAQENQYFIQKTSLEMGRMQILHFQCKTKKQQQKKTPVISNFKNFM